MELDVKIIRELMECMNSNKLDVLKVNTKEISIELERHNTVVQVAAPVEHKSVSVVATAESIQTVEPTGEEAETLQGNIMKSPIVGTFYLSPAPDKTPFVKVGSTVKKGEVLFIIESMKLMNEITSEFDGVVSEIFVENGKPVEFGQPIMRIE